MAEARRAPSACLLRGWMLPSGLEMSPPSIAVTAEILGKEKAESWAYLSAGRLAALEGLMPAM